VITGLKIMLDVGLYRLNQQVACQRYRQQLIGVKTSFSELKLAFSEGVKALTGGLRFAPAVA
jgi:hypothetical protein